MFELLTVHRVARIKPIPQNTVSNIIDVTVTIVATDLPCNRAIADANLVVFLTAEAIQFKFTTPVYLQPAAVADLCS